MPLGDAVADYDASRYKEAEAAARALLADPQQGADAHLLLARILFATGDYQGTQDHAQQAWQLNKEFGQAARAVAAEALWRQGEIDKAEAILAPAASEPAAWETKRLLGELYLQQGRRAEAEPLLRELIDAYNDDRIAENDAAALAQVGRAADRLRSPQDANDAYNMAEQASPQPSAQLLLWRAQLTLQRHDPEQAEQLLSELLQRSPNHALALALIAEAKLAQTMDFDAAEALARRALQINPHLSEARFVLAAVRVRDMESASCQRMDPTGARHQPA